MTRRDGMRNASFEQGGNRRPVRVDEMERELSVLKEQAESLQAAIASLEKQLGIIGTDLNWRIFSRVDQLGLTTACTSMDIIRALQSKGNYSMLTFPAFRSDFPNLSFGSTSQRHLYTVKYSVDAVYIIMTVLLIPWKRSC